MDKKRIVILGGGYAGVHAAKRLHKAFKKMKDQVEVTLIDRHRHHILMTELHEVAGNRVDEASVKISFDRIFAGKMVNVVRDEIKNIDFEKQVLEGAGASYGYDQLIIATGAESTDFNIPGVKEHSFYLWSLEDACRIKRHLIDTVKAAAYEKDETIRKEMLTFVVAGGGFTGVELVGELIEWLPILCKEYGVDFNEVKLMNVEALGNILNMLPDKPRDKAIAYMKKKGVEIRTQSLIVNADENGFTIKDGTVIKTKTLVWTCGVRGTTFCHSLPLTDGKVQRKKVNEFMQSPDHENVYLAGDGIWFMEDGKPVPQIVEAAEQTAATAADGIIHTIRGELGLPTKPVAPFKSAFHGYMVSIGGRYAVSYNMGMALSGFFAQAVKHLVNMYYQFGVCGVNGAWTYFKHEILNIKHRRSLIGGMAAYKVPSYWIVFLRMYLGVMWLIEGGNKILEGWLTDTTGRKVYWGPLPGAEGDAVAAGAEAVTEAVGSASTWAEPVVEAVSSASTAGSWDAGTAVADAAGEVVTKVKQFAPPLLDQPLAIYTWINETFVASAPYLFQIMIVLAEVGIGLCFLGGLFTFPAAIVSIGLSIMFLIGALAGKEILWYMAVSIVMLGGAGRAFGLDYWVMPYLKKLWNKTPIAKKLYFFMDEPEFTRKQMERRIAKQKDAAL
ncbi:MAG TPA: pyridine nucleotide-disulfide oxidoreductase [Sphaerochaeta sp.]|nr:MAG: pyridine nucleotide-disulfide oxidoreductase [Spirochaetes bacterium GWC2_52_13]OHD66450.1 MAG: pyridine nucleotide-disulfide oxidoreductase [Spirochaetes bacterium GWF2_52_7]PKL21847.1 MAG: pyridine nucleotide-disulfide oxidoreductase [Spirochaetae bacterium HGW-Spirochaetae-4]HCG63032.1 pyridine nucleotide-disulfide oxidoreductase [Sphaerochaeta sp.]HCJ94687.1 pyridine nucleotide-disulfide oxidoreductase [Sphaerochaeta sp.]